jgi:polysaccharide chain length determinant protein (PEP-CTERM system associated)
MNVETGFQLADVWGFLRRRAKHMGAVAGVVALAAYWLAMALPNEYSSSSTILVEPQLVSKELVEAGVPESDLNARLHLMTAQILSRARLSRIIDDLKLYQQESKSMVRAEIIDMMRDAIRVAPVFSELETEMPVRQRDLEINTFRISFRHYDARTAMLVAQRLANDFIEQHISERVKLSQKSLEFIQAELERLSTRIREVEAQVAQVKAANPGRLPQDAGANQLRLDRIVGALTVARRSLADAKSDEVFYRSQSASAASMSAPNDDASPARRLQILELELQNQKARGFTEKHPDTLKTRLEIAALKQKLEAGETEAGGEEGITNFLQQSADAESRRAALRASAAEEEVRNLTQQADEIQALLGETPAVAEQLEALEREYRHLFASYQDFSNRQLEASVQANLERRQLAEQFRVLEAAFMAPAPTSPNRSVIVILGAIFGLALGAVVGVLLEASDPTVHNARQLQSSMRVPVLAAIPQIVLESDRAAQRRGQLRAALATVAVAVFGLVGGAINYAWVNGGTSSRPAETEEEAPPAVAAPGGEALGIEPEPAAPAAGGPAAAAPAAPAPGTAAPEPGA